MINFCFINWESFISLKWVNFFPMTHLCNLARQMNRHFSHKTAKLPIARCGKSYFLPARENDLLTNNPMIHKWIRPQIGRWAGNSQFRHVKSVIHGSCCWNDTLADIGTFFAILRHVHNKQVCWPYSTLLLSSTGKQVNQLFCLHQSSL